VAHFLKEGVLEQKDTTQLGVNLYFKNLMFLWTSHHLLQIKSKPGLETFNRSFRD
jgi:hypothetical protein